MKSLKELILIVFNFIKSNLFKLRIIFSGSLILYSIFYFFYNECQLNIFSVLFFLFLFFIFLSDIYNLLFLSSKVKKNLVKTIENLLSDYYSLLQLYLNYSVTYKDLGNTSNKAFSLKNSDYLYEIVSRSEMKCLNSAKDAIGKVYTKIYKRKLFDFSLIDDLYESINDIRKIGSNFIGLMVLENDINKENFIKERTKKEILKNQIIRLTEYLGISTIIMKDYVNNINDFSYNSLINVINNFTKISDYAQNIEKSVEESISRLINPDDENSFKSMEKGAEYLTNAFSIFYENMLQLKNSSYNFIETTINTLKEIEKINDEIQRIAKTMHILSINVGIEAANAGENAKGFQILARDIREFAERTSNFVVSVKKKISEAVKNTIGLKEGYEINLSSVFHYIDVIKEYLLKLKSSLSYSTPKLDEAVKELRDFASKLDKDVKESIIQLQSHDIVKQEIEHLKFLNNFILNEFNLSRKEIGIPSASKDVEKEIVIDIISYLDKIITTKNERKILENLKKKYDISNEFDGGINDEDDNFIML